MGRKRSSYHHLPAKMYLKCGSYYFVDASAKWTNLGRNYSDAIRKYADLIEVKNTNIITISDLIDRYMIEVSPAKAAKTHQGHLYQAPFLKAALGHIKVVDLRSQDVHDYQVARGVDASVQTNRERALLSHMITKAIEWGLVSTNVCRGVFKFEENPGSRYITDDEYLAFRSFAGDFISAYMDFKLLTGLRQTDILNLREENLTTQGISLVVSKTKTPLIIKWSDDLRVSIENILRINRPRNGVVFRTQKGTAYTGSGFSTNWQKKMRLALDLGILEERFTERDIRAKTGSDSKGLIQASRLLGHTSTVVTKKHYRRKAEIVDPLF